MFLSNNKNEFRKKRLKEKIRKRMIKHGEYEKE